MRTISLKTDKEMEEILAGLPPHVNHSAYIREAVKVYNPLVGEKGYRKNVKKQLGY